MQPNIRVMLFDEDGERFFGEGPLRLLHAVEETGSLRSAAQSMEMAYTKALHLLRRAEAVLGFAFTRRTIGGRGGGGAEARVFSVRWSRPARSSASANTSPNSRVTRRLMRCPTIRPTATALKWAARSPRRP